MTATLILTVYIGLIALLCVSRASAETRTGPPAAQIARTVVATWQCQDKLPRSRTPASNPWRPHHPGWRASQLNTWLLRLADCRNTLHERARQWHWEEWLPRNWYLVARCETGVNWEHANSRFVSAFGISVREYDNDAAYMHARPWYVRGQGVPSPWEQYQAALGHYKRFGDGWSCPGP